MRVNFILEDFFTLHTESRVKSSEVTFRDTLGRSGLVSSFELEWRDWMSSRELFAFLSFSGMCRLICGSKVRGSVVDEFLSSVSFRTGCILMLPEVVSIRFRLSSCVSVRNEKNMLIRKGTKQKNSESNKVR